MGGLCCTLVAMWCRSGCSTQDISAMLTFYPPDPPSYTLHRRPKPKHGAKLRPPSGRHEPLHSIDSSTSSSAACAGAGAGVGVGVGHGGGAATTKSTMSTSHTHAHRRGHTSSSSSSSSTLQHANPTVAPRDGDVHGAVDTISSNSNLGPVSNHDDGNGEDAGDHEIVAGAHSQLLPAATSGGGAPQKQHAVVVGSGDATAVAADGAGVGGDGGSESGSGSGSDVEVIPSHASQLVTDHEQVRHTGGVQYMRHLSTTSRDGDIGIAGHGLELVEPRGRSDSRSRSDGGDAIAIHTLPLATAVTPASDIVVHWRELYELPPELEPHFSVRILRTSSGTTIPLFTFALPQAEHILVYSHGNATDCGQMRDQLLDIGVSLGVSVAMYDYSGYGAASGMPTEKQTYHDIEAVYKALTATYPPEKIIVYGQSVGSGPSCWLASRYTVHSLILHSPIMSGLRVITTSRALCCCDIFPNIDRVRKVHCPVLLLHGNHDEEVHVNHSRQLYRKIPEQHRRDPWFRDYAGHNDIYARFRDEYLMRLASFLQEFGIPNRMRATQGAHLFPDSESLAAAAGGGGVENGSGSGMVTANGGGAGGGAGAGAGSGAASGQVPRRLRPQMMAVLRDDEMSMAGSSIVDSDGDVEEFGRRGM